MSYIARNIIPYIEKDLRKKMVFLSGPRQCGKTTLATSFLKHNNGKYYNWDSKRDRQLILKENFDFDSDLWILDEIHKFRKSFN